MKCLQLADCLLHLRRFEAALSPASMSVGRGSQAAGAVPARLSRCNSCTVWMRPKKLYERLLAIDPAAKRGYQTWIAMEHGAVRTGARAEVCRRAALEINAHSTVAWKGWLWPPSSAWTMPRRRVTFIKRWSWDPEIMHPPVEPSDAVEYRISRKISLLRPKKPGVLKFKTARASTHSARIEENTHGTIA